jgi:hypothetical protein
MFKLPQNNATVFSLEASVDKCGIATIEPRIRRPDQKKSFTGLTTATVKKKRVDKVSIGQYSIQFYLKFFFAH